MSVIRFQKLACAGKRGTAKKKTLLKKDEREKGHRTLCSTTRK